MWRFALALLLLWPAQATAGPALFDAFLDFCAATGAIPDAVQAKVEAKGGEHTHSDGAAARRTSPIKIWKLGPNLSVDAGTLDDVHTDRTLCTVNGPPHDAASLASAAQWAGVARDEPSGPTLANYSFRDEGGRHVPLTPEEALRRTNDPVTTTWSLTLFGSRRATVITLERNSPKSR
jgi:hypothetical protein